jgi:hypothetical protein
MAGASDLIQTLSVPGRRDPPSGVAVFRFTLNIRDVEGFCQSNCTALAQGSGEGKGAMPRPCKPANPFGYYHSSPEVIRLVVMMYVRYPLSLRNVEDLLCARHRPVP